MQGSVQVPHLYLAIRGPTDNPVVVQPDAAHQTLMSLQNPETGPDLDVPQSDCSVRAATDHQPVLVLQGGDSFLVTFQSSNRLVSTGGPNLENK